MRREPCRGILGEEEMDVLLLDLDMGDLYFGDLTFNLGDFDFDLGAVFFDIREFDIGCLTRFGTSGDGGMLKLGDFSFRLVKL